MGVYLLSCASQCDGECRWANLTVHCVPKSAHVRCGVLGSYVGNRQWPSRNANPDVRWGVELQKLASHLGRKCNETRHLGVGRVSLV
jgi:hypothetical protein